MARNCRRKRFCDRQGTVRENCKKACLSVEPQCNWSLIENPYSLLMAIRIWDFIPYEPKLTIQKCSSKPLCKNLPKEFSSATTVSEIQGLLECPRMITWSCRIFDRNLQRQ